MDLLCVYFGLLLCFTNIGMQNAQTALPKPKVEPATATLNSGVNATLECFIDQSTLQDLVIAQMYVQWHYQSSSSSTSVKLSNYNIVEDQYSDKYTVTLKGQDEKDSGNTNTDSSGITWTLTIKDVQVADAGVYTCKVVKKNDEESGSSTVIVRKPISTMMFKLNDKDQNQLNLGIQQTEPIYVQLEEGMFKPSCSAGGSIPDAKVEIYLNDIKLPGQQINIDGQDGVQFQAAEIKLMTKNSKDILKCVVEVPGLTSSIVERSWSLDILSNKPDVKCSNKSVAIGTKYYTITCHVSVSRGNFMCSNIMWIKSGNNEEIQVYNSNKRSGKYDITCAKKNESFAETSNTINEFTKGDEEWSILFNSTKGFSSKLPVRIPQHINGASPLHSITSMLVVAVTMVLQWML